MARRLHVASGHNTTIIIKHFIHKLLEHVPENNLTRFGMDL
jgi:hypothetical protein